MGALEQVARSLLPPVVLLGGDALRLLNQRSVAVLAQQLHRVLCAAAGGGSEPALSGSQAAPGRPCPLPLLTIGGLHVSAIAAPGPQAGWEA